LEWIVSRTEKLGIDQILELENWRSKKAANSTNYSKRGKYKSINPWTDIG
jgi:hypothetical protein